MDPISNSETPEAKLHFLDYWRIIRIRKTIILTVFLLVVVTTTGVTFYLPEWYVSKASMSVEKDTPDINGISTPQVAQTYDPYWLQTEFEKIKSTSTLYPVIEDLKLADKWGAKSDFGRALSEQEVYESLSKQIEVKVAKNTTIIEVSAYSKDKTEARDIANSIAYNYRRLRDSNRKDYKGAGITILQTNLNTKLAEVVSMQADVDRMRETNKIPDMGGDGLTPTVPTLSTETIRALEERRIAAQAEYQKALNLYQNLTKLSPEKLQETIPTALPDQELGALLGNLHYAEQSLTMVTNSDLGPMHESVRKAKALYDVTKKQVDEKIQGMLQGLALQVAYFKTQFDSVVEDFDKAKEDDINRAAKYRPYYEAKSQLELLKQVKNALMLRIQAEEVEMALPTTSKVQILNPAEIAQKPVRPNKPLNIVLGVVVGLAVGIGLAFFIEYLDTSVKTIDDVEKALQAPVLGVIPQNVGTILDEGPESPHAEAYRVLRTNLLFSRKDPTLNSLTVVSGGAGEGKSTTLFNLATVFAQNGHRVLVVDSDLRRPSIHKMLKVSNSIGLTNYLLKQNTLEEVIQTTKLPTMDIMASGKLPSSSMGILSSVQMKNLVAELKRRYDFVFFDSPPIMGVSDASILASEVDLVLQVIQYRRYPQPMTVRAKQMIQKVGGNLLGLVLNNINMSQDENYYYYSGYYYNYYSKPDQDEPGHRTTTPVAVPAANGQPSADSGRPAAPRIKPKF